MKFVALHSELWRSFGSQSTLRAVDEHIVIWTEICNQLKIYTEICSSLQLMPVGQLRSLRGSDLSVPSRAYSDLTDVKNESKIPMQNSTSAGTAPHCASSRETRGHQELLTVTLSCALSSLVVSKYSTFRLAVLRLSCYELLETADVSIVISVIVHR